MVLLSSTEVECEDSLGAINTAFEQFYRNGWTDGLPIIPPTRGSVDAMMSTVDMAASDIAGKLGPRFADATVEKIAINAVMAGCSPSYFPVVITAVEAICAPEFGVQLHQVTTSPTAIMLLINGPVRKKIDLNCGWGLFGPGWRANATIGRAISLIMQNIGGRIPGEATKSVFANPGRYTMCVGEREEVSPWEPFHEEMGFSHDESTVTVAATKGYHALEEIVDVDGERVLDSLASMVRYPFQGLIDIHWGENVLFLFLCPEYVREVTEAGYSKKDVQEYFYEHTKDVPRSVIPKSYMTHIEEFDKGGHRDSVSSKKARIEAGLVKPGQNQITEKGVALAARADQFKIIVAGGDGGINAVAIPPQNNSSIVIRAITCARKGVL